MWSEIRKEIDVMRIVDNHEHLNRAFPIFTNDDKYEMDLKTFLTYGYLFGDLISAGMKGPPVRLGELKQYIEDVKNTSYYRYLLIALHDLFGLEEEDLNDRNWDTISSRIVARSEDHVKWSIEVLDKMGVFKVILDISKGCLANTKIIEDPRLVQVVKMDDFITGVSDVAAPFTDEKIQSVDEYCNALDMAFEKAIKDGAIGVKSALAYNRVISHETIEKSTAERIFRQGVKASSPNEKKAFQDFMMHAVCERCDKYRLPLQVHTGIQAGNYNTITNAKPTHLTTLFRKYPRVRFDLFHGGYPYMQEAGILAKYFPNVYLDACWLDHISPTAYRKGLSEWLEIVPSNKIFAWGGDHEIIEHSYASLMLVKDLIADVLSEKVHSGYFTKEVAMSTARKILGENAIKLYRF
jgi:hypothetical protein